MKWIKEYWGQITVIVLILGALGSAWTEWRIEKNVAA